MAGCYNIQHTIYNTRCIVILGLLNDKDDDDDDDDDNDNDNIHNLDYICSFVYPHQAISI
jgi:hypothetical protein